MNLLRLLSVGISETLRLEELCRSLELHFGASCEIHPQRLDPEFAFHSERLQYHSTEILARMTAYLRPDTWRILGITAVDLYIPILTFVFGEAQLGRPCALVSSFRLRQEFYGLPPDPALLQARILKESLHELGHTLELTHCTDYSCAMAASHAVEWIDLKQDRFCPACSARITQIESKTRLVPHRRG